MPKVKKITGMAPLPQYIMPDASEPEYGLILEQLQDYRQSLIGTSYYYIRAVDDRRCLAESFGSGKSFSTSWWITAGMASVMMTLKNPSAECRFFFLAGYYPISPHVEQKLRILYD
jgi:hypothetical protein